MIKRAASTIGLMILVAMIGRTIFGGQRKRKEKFMPIEEFNPADLELINDKPIGVMLTGHQIMILATLAMGAVRNGHPCGGLPKTVAFLTHVISDEVKTAKENASRMAARSEWPDVVLEREQ